MLKQFFRVIEFNPLTYLEVFFSFAASLVIPNLPYYTVVLWTQRVTEGLRFLEEPSFKPFLYWVILVNVSRKQDSTMSGN